MPAGPIGSVWTSGSWSDTCWEVDTWADAVAGVSPDATVITVRARARTISVQERARIITVKERARTITVRDRS